MSNPADSLTKKNAKAKTAAENKTPWVTGRLGRFGTGQRLLFGATYEDPAIEIGAFADCKTVICIAGAGDLARSLAEAGFVVTALDINQKQIDYALARSNGGAFRRGSAERIMALGRLLLRPAGWSSKRMATLANSATTEEQLALWNTLTTGFSGFVLRVLLSPAKLAAAFRPEFVSLVGQGFASRLVSTLRSSLANVPNTANPFASLLFQGIPAHAAQPKQTGKDNNPQFLCANILTYLSAVPPGSFDAAAMSNIGDGAPESFREELDRALRRALKPGAPVTVRTMGNISSLSSTMQLGTLACEPMRGADLARSRQAMELAATDRSLIWAGLEIQHNVMVSNPGATREAPNELELLANHVATDASVELNS
jgi:S-adenosylmethionine:diacylglycerol 3-amino-3-carboxypropyl transferase